MKKILIIDDDEKIRNLLKRVLQENGYDIYEAENGKVGLRIFNENDIDLAIVDIIMPDMEGLETIRNLKQGDGHLKIISMTGGGGVDPATYLKMSEALGADLSFMKPIKNNLLIDAIENLLAHA